MIEFQLLNPQGRILASTPIDPPTLTHDNRGMPALVFSPVTEIEVTRSGVVAWALVVVDGRPWNIFEVDNHYLTRWGIAETGRMTMHLSIDLNLLRRLSELPELGMKRQELGTRHG